MQSETNQEMLKKMYNSKPQKLEINQRFKEQRRRMTSYYTRFQQAVGINPATLSGAVDIIVVQHNDKTMKATPFYCRFGKLKILLARKVWIKLTVNDTPIEDVYMRLNEKGMAYFATEKEIKEYLETINHKDNKNDNADSQKLQSKNQNTPPNHENNTQNNRIRKRDRLKAFAKQAWNTSFYSSESSKEELPGFQPFLFVCLSMCTCTCICVCVRCEFACLCSFFFLLRICVKVLD